MSLSITRGQSLTVSGANSVTAGYLNPVWYTGRQFTNTFQGITQPANVRIAMSSTAGIVAGHRLRVAGTSPADQLLYPGTEIATVIGVVANSYIEVSGLTFRGTVPGYIMNLTTQRNLSLETRLVDAAGNQLSKALSTWFARPNLEVLIDLQSELKSLFFAARDERTVYTVNKLEASTLDGKYILQYREVYWDSNNVKVIGTYTNWEAETLVAPARKQIQEKYGNNLIDYALKSIDGFSQFLNPSFAQGLKYWGQTQGNNFDKPWEEVPGGIVARTRVLPADQFINPEITSATGWSTYGAGAVSGWTFSGGKATTTPDLANPSQYLANDRQFPVGSYVIFFLRHNATGGGNYTIEVTKVNAAGVVDSIVSSDVVAADGVVRTFSYSVNISSIAGTRIAIRILSPGPALVGNIEYVARAYQSYALRQLPFGYFAQTPIQANDVITMDCPERQGEIVINANFYVTNDNAYPTSPDLRNNVLVPVEAFGLANLGSQGNVFQFIVLSNADVFIRSIQKNGRPPGNWLTRFNTGIVWKGVPRSLSFLNPGTQDIRVLQYSAQPDGGFIVINDSLYTALPAGVYHQRIAYDATALRTVMTVIAPTGPPLAPDYTLFPQDFCAPAVLLEWQNSLGGFDQHVFGRTQGLSLNPSSSSAITERYEPNIEASTGGINRDWTDTQAEATLYDDFVPTEIVYWLDEIKKSKSVRLIFANGASIFVVPVSSSTLYATRTKQTQYSLSVRFPPNFSASLADSSLS